jgi:ribulose-5-phosphate 4-epimerase/fuculose-1-phosphate aldolase
VCFAAFVKFFSDMLYKKKRRLISLEEARFLDHIRRGLSQPVEHFSPLASAPFETETEALNALEEAGKKVVDYGLVDSYFGNISYRFRRTLYISQTGSSLDELSGSIDPCPLDGSSCAGITASSELSTHMEIVKRFDAKAILHGHPRFSVIISMDCDSDDCPGRGFCHRKCPEKRNLGDIPIVSGEVGTGPFGLCRTVPEAVEKAHGAIVYGHGVFTTGKEDFNEAFLRMLTIENASCKEYFRRLDT